MQSGIVSEKNKSNKNQGSHWNDMIKIQDFSVPISQPILFVQSYHKDKCNDHFISTQDLE